MSTKKKAYQISILAGGKVFAGMTENALAVKPNYETILDKSLNGAPVDELVSFDVEMNVVGLTYEKSLAEESTHQDFTELRQSAASGGTITFIYGEITDGGDVVVGDAKITDYNEVAGSSKSSAGWNLKLKAVKGTVAFNSYGYLYADPDGSESGDGSYEDPWTIDYALTQASSGDTIYLKPGTYNVSSQLAVPVGVSLLGAGDTSIITSNQALEPIIKLSSASQGTNGNQSISYIKVDGAGVAVVGIAVYARSNVEIHHCTFTDFVTGEGFAYGLYVSGLVSGSGEPTTYATGNSVHDCTFTDCSEDTYVAPNYLAGAALTIGGQSGALIYNNTINENYGRHAYGIKTAGDGYNKGMKIYDNTIICDIGRGVQGSWSMAIEMWSQRGGIEIYDNIIRNGSIDIAGYDTNDAGGYGYAVRIYSNSITWDNLISFDDVAIRLELDISGGTYIYNNYFHNVSTVLSMAQYDGDKVEDVYFYYNICNEIRLSTAGYTGRITSISSVTGSVTYTDINFYNNTIYNSSQTIGSAFHFNTDNATVSYIRVINNIIVNAYNHMRFENHNPDYLWSTNNNVYGCHQNTITYYNSTPGANVTQANNSLITDDPVFVTAGSDFHLDTGSPCINAGAATGQNFITEDYDGVAVANPPEIGAYEYV